MAAKREEYVRRERRDDRRTSGERPALQSPDAAPDTERAGSGRPEPRGQSGDSASSGSILDRLGYVPTEARVSGTARRRPPAMASGAPPRPRLSDVDALVAAAPDTWSTSLGSPSLPAPELDPEAATTPPPHTLRDQLAQSGGFYSRVVPAIESVSIPRPPRLPDLDPKDVSEGPPPGSDTPPAAARPRPTPEDGVLIPPLLRRQAEEWKQTGSLSLPSTVSSRHARALQRALLLSLLQSGEFSLLPEGIAQRAAWMFREGWGEGRKQRDADDLCFVLGLAAGPSARSAVIAAAQAHMPAEAILPPSSARWSSRPPRA